MDLLRRSGAGEVSALFGAAAVQFDEERRVHLLRDTAERVLNDAPAGYRGVLEAYAEGVNAGLDALGAKPFEYLLLRAEPSPWVAADSVLVAGAMYFDLEDDVRGLRKSNELVARSILPSALADVLYPSSTVWDAPLVGDAGAPASLPGPETYDLRRLPRELFGRHVNTAPEASLRGSNNWAVAGSQTTTGRALLANDPHLALRVPSIWFRTSLARDGWRVTGVSLPGWPRIVLGSNGNVAWGFTNSYGDWHDLIVLELDPEDPSRYRTPDGWAAFETVPAPIEVAGGSVHEFAVRRTIWGPVIGALPDGTPFAVRWLAHDPRGYVDGFGELAQTRSAPPFRRKTSLPPMPKATSAGRSWGRFRAACAMGACRGRARARRGRAGSSPTNTRWC
jgi:penicillin amidase